MLDSALFPAIIGAHVKQAEREHPAWNRRREMYRCQQMKTTTEGSPDSDLYTESGALYAYTDTMIASIVPPNPRITCVPRRTLLRDAAKYRAALVNDTLSRVGADRILWKMATHASVYPRGVLKAVWNHKRGRPDFLNVDPRNFFFDMEATRFEDIRYAIEVTVLTEAEFFARVPTKKKQADKGRIYDGNVARKVQFNSYPAWLKDTKTGRAELSDELRKVFRYAVIFEVYDFTVPGGRYFHFAQGVKEPLFQDDLPYVFVPNPFCILTFNDNLEDAGGLSDAEIVEGPVRRRDELLTLELRFAQATIPVTIVDEADMDDPESFKTALSSATSPGDVVTFKGKNGRKAEDVISQSPTAQLSPNFQSIDTKLDQEVMFRLGMPQYTRGVAGSSEIATELALVDAALRTRQGRRSKLVNHIITFMSKAVVGLYEEYMDGDSMLPVRLGKTEFMEIARQHLAARDPAKAEQILKSGGLIEEPLDIDYEVVPYSPVENSRSAQLQKLEKFLPLLKDNPAMNQRWLTQKVVENLEMGDDDDALVPEAPAAADPAVAGAAPPQPGAGGPPLPGGAPQQLAELKGGNLPGAIPAPPGVSTGARPGMAGGAGSAGPQA